MSEQTNATPYAYTDMWGDTYEYRPLTVEQAVYDYDESEDEQ